ncbi:uncharacterized protein B0T15DRAFT_39202 [Chaetomium strumarium]|uniref:Uncharacterized protein n=1 Tax=Chaetomium strumarium TaxID=1170767 RepID=A0AAJ0H263_9PEZI|nr:hypothetical protein B0T15DRAFT_39202 [Chaetomium strumarium]
MNNGPSHPFHERVIFHMSFPFKFYTEPLLYIGNNQTLLRSRSQKLDALPMTANKTSCVECVYTRRELDGGAGGSEANPRTSTGKSAVRLNWTLDQAEYAHQRKAHVRVPREKKNRITVQFCWSNLEPYNASILVLSSILQPSRAGVGASAPLLRPAETGSPSIAGKGSTWPCGAASPDRSGLGALRYIAASVDVCLGEVV